MSPVPRPWLSLAALLSLGPSVLNALSVASPQQRGLPGSAVGRAVYFITNDATNAIVALSIGPDGKLSPGTVTPTGGAGSVVLGADNKPVAVDTLVSQSSLTIVGNTIFAVNAGSNTLSMLSVSPSNPTKLALVGKPVPVPGDFPNTVAASEKHNLVCVGTSGARAGISCSRFSASGLTPLDDLRPFDFGQTTPPIGGVNTISQVFFSDKEDALFATVKGNAAANKPTFFSSFPVVRGGSACSPPDKAKASVSRVEQRSIPQNTTVLFGSQPIPGTNNVFATDAASGAAILAVDSQSGKATTIATVKISGQAATCWATISTARGTAFVADGGVNRLVELSLRDASVVSELDLSSDGDPGLLDLQAAGEYIYALSPGAGVAKPAITVVRASGRSRSASLVQHYALEGVAGQNSMGLAVLL